jgi:GAF domain-containing protein
MLDRMSSATPPSAPLETWLDALADIGEAVGGDTPVADLLDRVTRTACALLGYDFCAVFLPDRARGALVIEGSHGLSTEYVARVNADHPVLLDVRGPEEAPTSLAFRTGEVVTLEDIALAPGFGPWGGVAQEQGYRALVSVPLRRDGEVVGALNGYRTTPHVFDAAEIGLVSTLATQVAIALRTAQLRAREQDTIRDLRRAEEIHGQLTATALRGEGVAGVASALADLLERDLLVEDRYGTPLATVGGSRPPVDVGPGLDDDLVRGGLLAAEPDGHAVAGVVLDGEVIARVHVSATPTDLSTLDVRAVEHAAVVIGLEMLRARTAAEVEQRLRGNLVADLLSAEPGDAAALGDRARRLGWDPTGEHLLVAVRCLERPDAAGQHATERLLAEADQVGAAATPHPLVATHRGDVVLVWPAAAREPATRAVERLVGSLEGTVQRVVGAVVPAAPQGELASSYRMVRGALDLAAGGTGPAVVDLHDMAIDHLLLQLDDPDRLRMFARSVLAPALDYDGARATALVSTVRTYLDHDLDRRAAAEALHLHPNTVLQRIRRFEALTGLRLAHPRDLMRLSAALTVSRIAGLG